MRNFDNNNAGYQDQQLDNLVRKKEIHKIEGFVLVYY